MGRYPSKNGIALPVQEVGYETVPHERGKTTNHHRQYTREQYRQTRIGQVFRGLLSNLDILTLPDHVNLHNRFAPPIMPSEVQMIDVVEEYLFLHGQIDVVREKKTNETYPIFQDQWNVIRDRGAYGSQILTAGNQVAPRVA